MIETLYVNGCSWTAGDELDCDPNFNEILKDRKLKLSNKMKWQIVDENDNYVAPPTDIYNEINWGAHLKNKLNIPVYINNSLGGGSNDRIVRTTVDYVMSYPEDKRDELLIVIGWTGSDRKEVFFNRSKTWERFNPTFKFTQTYENNKKLTKFDIQNLDLCYENYVYYFNDYQESNSRYFQQIYLLSNLLDNLKIKYLFFDAFATKGGVYWCHVVEKIKMFDKEIEWFDKKNTIYGEKTMRDFVEENNYPLAPYKHPLIEGHEKWAQHLIDIMKEKQIL